MAVQDFVDEFVTEMLRSKKLSLQQEDFRICPSGAFVSCSDATADLNAIWKTANKYVLGNPVFRSDILMINLKDKETGASGGYAHSSIGELYRRYRKEGMRLLVRDTAATIEESFMKIAGSENLRKKAKSFNAVKNLLLLRPANFDDYKDDLASLVYRRVGDIALVVYLNTKDANSDSQTVDMSVLVNRSYCDTWGIHDMDTLINQALENTMRMQPPALLTMPPTIIHKGHHVLFMEDDESLNFDFAGTFAPLLTTTADYYGAIAAFYPGVLRRLHQIIGGDFYVLFSGCHAAIVKPVNASLPKKTAQALLDDMNKKVHSDQDILSRYTFIYRGDTDTLSLLSEEAAEHYRTLPCP